MNINSSEYLFYQKLLSDKILFKNKSETFKFAKNTLNKQQKYLSELILQNKFNESTKLIHQYYEKNMFYLLGITLDTVDDLSHLGKNSIKFAEKFGFSPIIAHYITESISYFFRTFIQTNLKNEISQYDIFHQNDVDNLIFITKLKETLEHKYKIGELEGICYLFSKYNTNKINIYYDSNHEIHDTINKFILSKIISYKLTNNTNNKKIKI